MYGRLFDSLAAGATVVTANNRLARTLVHVYDQQMIDAGRAAWPTPDILSWSAWQQRLLALSRLRGGLTGGQRLLDDQQALLLWQQKITQLERDRSDMPFAQFARSAWATWKLLNEWEAVAEPEWTDAGLTSDQQAFLRWAGEYRKVCDASLWIDTARLPALLADDAEAGLFDDLQPLVFAGFDEWSPARFRLRSALEQRTGSVSLYQSEKSDGSVSLSGCSSPDDELLRAARWARTCFEHDPQQAIAVVVPDLSARAETVRRVFADIWVPDWRSKGLPDGLPLNLSYGRPLAQTPVVDAALRLLRLTDGRATFNDFSLFLRSPWLKGAADEAAARALLEVELRDCTRIEFALADVAALCTKRAPVVGAIINHVMALSGLRERCLPTDWALKFADFLQAVGWPDASAPDSETWQTLKAWNELLRAFAASGDVAGPLSRGEAVALLGQLAQQRLFQPEGVDSGVQVMGVLEAAGHRFDKLWVCGMARELWPPASRPDPFIPLQLQRRLRMPDSSAARVLEYTRKVTGRLINCADQAVCSWPMQLDGEELRPSPLVQDSAVMSAQVSGENAVWNESAFGQGNLELLERDPPPVFPAGATARGGVSVLNLQAVSPLNAFIERRLGAFEMRVPPIGINAMQKGNLTHRALEDLYRAHPSRDAVAALSPEDRTALLRQSLEQGLKRLPGSREPFMQKLAALEMVQQLDRLQRFIAIDLDRSDFTVASVEEPREVAFGPLNLRLKLDRLDRLPDGSTLVIDYKTGQVNRQAWNPHDPRDLQLPLYVTAVATGAAAISFAQISVQGIGFDGVGGDEVNIPGIRSPGKRQKVQVRYQYPQTNDVIETWEDLRETWAKVLLELAETFAAGDFRLDPRNPQSATGQFAVLSRVYDAGLGMLEDEL